MGPARSQALERKRLEYRSDGLVGRLGDEGAGVHDDHVGLGGASGLAVARSQRPCAHLVGIDLVLRTAEGYEGDGRPQR
jgi:hypothetical protein